MAGLRDQDRRYLRQMGWMQPVTVGASIVSVVAGVAYIGWALLSFDYRKNPLDAPAFDRPVLKIAAIYEPYRRTLDKITPETGVELILLDMMKGGLVFSTGMMVLLLRLFLGTLVLLFGLVSLTVVVERRRILAIVERLLEPETDRPT